MELTPDNLKTFEEIVARYPVKRSALLPTLRLVQEQEGWISREALEYVATLLDLSPAQVKDTASFYTMFRLEPTGETLIEVCTTLSCALGGSEKLMGHACRKLGIQPGGTTEDLKFTVKEAECLAASHAGIDDERPPSGAPIAGVVERSELGASEVTPMLHNFLVQDRYAASIAAFLASYSMFLNLT